MAKFLNGKCLKKSFHFFWTPSLSAGPRCQKVNMAGRRRQLPTDGKLIERRNILQNDQQQNAFKYISTDKKVRKKQKIGRYPMGPTIRSRSSRDECSTDIQSYTLDKQIIWINGSLSAQLERLFTDSAFSFLPQNSHLPTTLMMLST